ncbi:MAG: ABC transporter permease [Trueperaceae bacterium]|nr:ABC transporter permease [Trueperaceae bacterium]
MFNYLVRRLLTNIPVLLGISFITFTLVTFAPGDAISLMLGSETVNAANVERLRLELGLDKPWYVQYANYMKGLFQGDLGTSITSQQPVAKQIFERFPNTLVLTLSAMLVALLIAIPAGILSAARRNRPEDYGAMFFSMLGVAMPNFWLGLILILFFGLELRWLPIRGMGSLDEGFWDVISHLILPAFTLGTALAAILTRLTRNAMLDVLAEDYVRTAKAKGLKERIVLYKHALRNAIIPVLTTAGLQFGGLLGGAVIIETIFSWPGLGLLSINAIRQRDLPMIQGSVLVFALCFMLVTLLVDVLYSAIDPRIRYG